MNTTTLKTVQYSIGTVSVQGEPAHTKNLFADSRFPLDTRVDMRRLRLLAMLALAMQVTTHGEHGEYHDRHEHADHHENEEHHDHHDHDHNHDNDHNHHEHGHGHEGHDHAHDHDGLHDHHDTINVDAADWDKTVLADKHVWAVKFYSGMCSACRAFKPEWEAAHALVQGLHWAAVDIDKKANVELAQRYGVLDEGIPNVKLINAADVPLPVVTADVVKAAAVASALREKLASTNAVQDGAGFFVGRAKAEL